MPTRPPHPCHHPGCPALVTTRYCAAHAASADGQRGYDARVSSARRGYGWRWQQVRLDHLRREPLCRTCHAQGRLIPGEHVDHIIPKSEGGSDDERNLQSLCAACHNRKTHAERRAPRRAREEEGGLASLGPHDTRPPGSHSFARTKRSKRRRGR
jgi:5-methylcytosine-specific restriction protein A